MKQFLLILLVIPISCVVDNHIVKKHGFIQGCSAVYTELYKDLGLVKIDQDLLKSACESHWRNK